MSSPHIRTHISFADHTTFEVGGPAGSWAECPTEAMLKEALAWARAEGLMTTILGGGSNLLVADRGFDGLVIQPTDTSLDVRRNGDLISVRAGAGWNWDDFVGAMVDEGFGGIECLSGIPGKLGAAPIQNIGAYGQEVAETVAGVRAIGRFSGEAEELPADMLGFGYRQSQFKEDWRDRYAITRVDFYFQRTDRGSVRYPELKKHLSMSDRDPAPDLKTIRAAVLQIRREKSMVLDPEDPNRRSAGSFFVNPVVPDFVADTVQRKARERGTSRTMPRFATDDGIKLSAAWLIEEAGFPRGFSRGRAGLSSKHTLALINRGGASAEELVGLAREIRLGVHRAFGVWLTPEPVFLGFPGPVEALLA